MVSTGCLWLYIILRLHNLNGSLLRTLIAPFLEANPPEGLQVGSGAGFAPTMSTDSQLAGSTAVTSSEKLSLFHN